MTNQRTAPGRLGCLLLGFAFAFVVLLLAGAAYLRFGHLPVATADAALPFEAQIVEIPLEGRIKRDMHSAPIEPTETNLKSGAHLYVTQCASCHGIPGTDVAFAEQMYPEAPQLWRKHDDSAAVGVSDDEAGETYWKIDNGIRLTGMPAYNKVLSTSQMWQIALLMKHADRPLSPEVQGILQSAPAK